jgi:hypothetical protein
MQTVVQAYLTILTRTHTHTRARAHTHTHTHTLDMAVCSSLAAIVKQLDAHRPTAEVTPKSPTSSGTASASGKRSAQ